MKKRINLFPDECAHSAYRIDYQYYSDKGYKGVIYDIDNTLVAHDAPADDRARALFRKLSRIGMQAALVSNNEPPRVEMFNRDIGAVTVCRAAKPLAGGYEKAMERMGTDQKSTLVVGDQLFTDIWGANRCGLHSILVRRTTFHEPFHVHLKRLAEAPVMLIWNLFFRKEAVQIRRVSAEDTGKKEGSEKIAADKSNTGGSRTKARSGNPDK